MPTITATEEVSGGSSALTTFSSVTVPNNGVLHIYRSLNDGGTSTGQADIVEASTYIGSIANPITLATDGSNDFEFDQGTQRVDVLEYRNNTGGDVTGVPQVTTNSNVTSRAFLLVVWSNVDLSGNPYEGLQSLTTAATGDSKTVTTTGADRAVVHLVSHKSTTPSTPAIDCTEIPEGTDGILAAPTEVVLVSQMTSAPTAGDYTCAYTSGTSANIAAMAFAIKGLPADSGGGRRRIFNLLLTD